MEKIAKVRRHNTLKIVTSLMYLTLDEKRCTFYVDYFIIISFCNLLNLSIVKMNCAKFTTKIELQKQVLRNSQFLDLSNLNIYFAKISVLKVKELCGLNELPYSYIQAFHQLSRITNDHLQMPLNLKFFLLKSLNFMSCVGEVKTSFLSSRIEKHGRLFEKHLVEVSGH